MTVSNETMDSEVNVPGKMICGAQLRLSDYVPPSGTLEGWYRLTFQLATVRTAELRRSATEGTYLPTFTTRSTSIEIYIEP